MSNKLNFTKSALEGLPLPESGKRAEYQDTKTTGLSIRVTSTGVKTFTVYRWVSGKPERVTLGRFPAMNVDQARRRAAEVNGAIAKGASPVAEKKKAKLEAKPLREAFEDYISRRTLKPQTIFDIRRCMKEVYPDWLDHPMVKITGDMVVKRHQKYGAEHSEARSNLAFRYLRAIFNFAMAEYEDGDGQPIISGNPVKKLSATKAWHRVDRRQTLIKTHELQAWWHAVQALPSEDIRDYFTLLVLTGLRREEALGLTWENVDFVGNTLTVVDPKNHRDHTLPLSDFLFDLLTRRKSMAVSDFVFADSTGRRISNFRYALASIEKASGVYVTPHDLRRTFATVAEDLDISSYALKRLLNHADGADVTAGYIVRNSERLREPMQKITDFILRAAGVKETAPVVPLKQAKG